MSLLLYTHGWCRSYCAVCTYTNVELREVCIIPTIASNHDIFCLCVFVFVCGRLMNSEKKPKDGHVFLKRKSRTATGSCSSRWLNWLLAKSVQFDLCSLWFLRRTASTITIPYITRTEQSSLKFYVVDVQSLRNVTYYYDSPASSSSSSSSSSALSSASASAINCTAFVTHDQTRSASSSVTILFICELEFKYIQIIVKKE